MTMMHHCDVEQWDGDRPAALPWWRDPLSILHQLDHPDAAKQVSRFGADL
jgi:hypothetical protein